MHLLAVLLLAALTSAAAVREPAYQSAQPGSPIKRAEASSGPIVLEGLASNADVIVTVALVTPAPDAGVIRLDGDPDYESSSSCKPSSICFDGITCGLRYGGCFDRNFCDGSTSFPMPTCTDDPSAGLTQKMMKRAEELGAARKQ